MTTASELVHLSIERGIATITLDSPHNRNALSRQLVGELRRTSSCARTSTRPSPTTPSAPSCCRRPAPPSAPAPT